MKFFSKDFEQPGRIRLTLRVNSSKHIKRIAILSLACVVLIVWCASPSMHAASLPPGFAESLVTSGLTNPTAMAFSPDGRLFVCQQGGQLRVIKNGALLPTPFLTVNTTQSGERGLLGIAFDPAFATNQYVYVYYTAATAPIHNRVSRFTANGDVAVANSESVIIDLDNLNANTNHNGGAIHFGLDGKLYIAVGENANPANSQTLTNLLGKILRINSDGTIPSDNPFFNTATGANRAIWALGLRNPFTFAFQPVSGRMFVNDVGQNVFEEINDGIAGSNYGWPTCEGSCSNVNFRNPVFQYGHGVASTTGCAMTGGAFYNPSINQFPAEHTGKYFFADLCSGWIRRLDPSNNTATDFASGISQPVDLQVGPEGSLYYLARGTGSIFKITFSASQAPQTLQFSAGSYSVGEGGGSVNITITRSNGTSGEAAVDYSATSATASERTDYTTLVGRARFAAGETTKTLTLLVSEDGFVEGNEVVNLLLSNASGSIIGNSGTAAVTITDNDTSGTSNPIDLTPVFVRQHYHDFLNREPEPGGYQGWQDILNSCPQGSTACDRIEVSSAFFRSDEFQLRGYFVYRFYSTSFGRVPHYLEFMPDMARVSGFQSSQQEEASRISFIGDFMARQEFRNRYDQLTDPRMYVEGLEAAAGVTLVNREALIADLIAGRKTRAEILRAVAESQEVYTKYYNEAFVVMQYFGYLRRDPDILYLDWINTLNQSGDYRIMVNGFMNSIEYRSRFGP